MFPSETEIDARLAELRRQRDLVEREIADLLLYRDLGRRLGESEPLESSRDPGNPVPASQDKLATESRTDRSASAIDPRGDPSTGSTSGKGGSETADRDDGTADGAQGIPSARRPVSERRSPPVPPVAFEDDPVAARRYGRAILEAALDGLREAGRPLHAGEILERVIARGFTVPGQDPVAALNTRLWKRSGPGGPLRRLGDAVYALAEPISE